MTAAGAAATVLVRGVGIRLCVMTGTGALGGCDGIGAS